MLERIFLAHPRRVQEGYLAHLRAALGFALVFAGCAVAVAIHALVPCLFETTASRTVARLHDRMIVNRVNIRREKHRPA
ncbi:MAG TPA: DUF6356 family protein [Novosphingobium sp.]